MCCWVRTGRWRGGTGGRSSVVDCGVRLIFEGSTSRPGVRRGSPSKSGRCQRCWLPIVLSRASRDGDGPSWVLVRAPAAPRARLSVRGSVKGGGLPAEGGELARDRDRDHAGGLAPPVSQLLPARVQAALGTPGDLDHAWVLAGLAAGEHVADSGRVAVVVGCLDQQPPRVGGPGLGDRSLPALG